MLVIFLRGSVCSGYKSKDSEPGYPSSNSVPAAGQVWDLHLSFLVCKILIIIDLIELSQWANMWKLLGKAWYVSGILVVGTRITIKCQVTKAATCIIKGMFIKSPLLKEDKLYLNYDYEWFNFFDYLVFSKLYLMNMYFWYNGENNFIVEKDYSLVSILLPKSSRLLCSGGLSGWHPFFVVWLVAGAGTILLLMWIFPVNCRKLFRPRYFLVVSGNFFLSMKIIKEGFCFLPKGCLCLT